MLSGKSSNSMRDNYGTHGVENYYRMVQESCALPALARSLRPNLPS